MKKRYWHWGVETAQTYFRVACGLFTIYFCRCGTCFLPLLLAHVEIVRTRTCGFCLKRFTYDEMSEGSIVYLDICACADCLEKDATAEFRDLISG